ncbi:unnamed protein product [Ectocarpus sp. CCAP 1310/34]|nr:unnamed protein product [Ectocarpus sp. CCAP 1310/34]
MLKQFPVVSGQVDKDEQLSMEAPFGRHASCLDDMWDVLDKRAFAHTPAVHGDDLFSVSSTNARSSSAVSRAVASSALRSTVTPSWSQGSSAAVMSVEPLPNDDRDPFLLHYSDWPLQGHFQEVYNVASEMALTKNDPPLFTPLVSAEERRNPLRLYKGKCLNCLGEYHSFKSCNRGFVNATGLLNNDIKFCMEKDPTLWGRWKKRMTSYRRPTGRNPHRNHPLGRARRSSDTSDTKQSSHTEHSSDASTSTKRGWRGMTSPNERVSNSRMASANIDPAGAAALRPPSGSRSVATSPAPASLSGSSPSEKRTRRPGPPPPVPGARSLPLRPAPAPPFDDKCEYASDDVLLFWKPPSVFSQWTPSAFDVLGVRYSCGEQLMMSEKAKLFGDMTSYDKIMAATDPKTHKFLGRNVRPFDYAEWERRREEIVLTGSYAKFAQNHDMKHHLLETGTRLLAEASPFDRVWGIGMSACCPDASDSSKWAASGKNLLGKALMEVRRLLRDHPLSGKDFPASNSPTPPISQPPLHGHRRIHEVATATGYAELEPGDVIGVSAAPLLRVPVETLKAAPSSIPTGPTTSTSPPRVNAVGPKSGTHRSPDPASAPPPPKPLPQELLDRFSEAQRSSFMRLWARLPAHMHDIAFDLHNPGWTPEAIDRLADALVEYSDVFSTSKTDFGSCTIMPFTLSVPAGTKPVASRPYRINPLMQKKVDAVLDQYLAAGLIQHSTSPWASPLVVIPKKDGSVRITVNYKRLNALVDLDGQALHRVDGILDSLYTGKVFSIFDLNSAFHQIVCDEDTVPLTAFCTPTQLFEWLRMPQGANASPSWFVKVINRVVHGLERVLAYLDDVICFDEEPLGHVLNLIEFFKRLRQYNLKLSPGKGRVGATHPNFLGHTISPVGVSPDGVKVRALTHMPPPTNVKQLRSLLGGLSYYRKFLKNLATKVRPLNSLLKQGVPFKYTPGMVMVVKTLLSELARPPTLDFPDWAAIEDNSRPLRLCSDACIDGFGASMKQEPLDDSVRPIVYISRATLPAERNWTVLDLEAGGIVWAIKRLRGYLWSTKFIIYSDHKALESIGKVGEHNASVQRWLEFLSNFIYTLKYRKGSANGNADFLSRLPLPAQDTDKTGPDCIDGVDQAGVFLIWACGRNYHSSSTPETNGGTERVNHTMAQMLEVVVNDQQNDWDIHLPHVEFAYNNSVNQSTGLAPNEIHIGRIPRLPLSVFDRPTVGGHQSLARDQLEYCNLAVDRQRRAYELVREYNALKISRVERRNSSLLDAIHKLPQFTVGGWAWVYNTAATIRPGVQKDTDQQVLKAKFALSWTGPYKVLAVAPTSADATLDGRPLAHNLLYLDLPSDLSGPAARCRVSVLRCKPCRNPYETDDLPQSLPAELSRYVLHSFGDKCPPFHVTADDMSVPVGRLEVDYISGHQLVRGRCGVLAVLYQTHWVGLTTPSWERESDLDLFRRHILLYRSREACQSKQGGKSVSGLMFADDFVGVSETPEGLQEQIDAAVGYTRKWRLSANVGKCAVVVCSEEKKNPVEFKWKWGEEELPVVDRYTYLGVEISKECSWDAHKAKLIGKGKAQIGKMDEILTDPHLDTRIKRCVLLNLIVPKLEYAGEVWEGKEKAVKQLETVQMTAAKKILGCSSTTSNTVLRAELGMYSLKTKRDMQKLNWQYKVSRMSDDRLPAMVDKAAWGKATPGKKGIRWDKVVERVWKEIGDEEETLDTEGFGGFKKKVKEMLESREEATLRKKVRSEDHLEIYGKLKEGIGTKSYLDGPMDYAKKLKLQFRVGDLDLPERRKRYSSRRREEEEDRQTCPCGKSEESRPHIVGECELYRKEREDLEEDMRQRGCDMDKFGKLDNSEKTIAVIGDRWWAQEAVEDGDKTCKKFLCSLWQKRKELPNVGGVSIRGGNGAPSRKGRVANGQMTTASNK